MLWINFFHLYQPANSAKEHIIDATGKSYDWIIGQLEENPQARMTMNISGCLLERWQDDLDYSELINRIMKLIQDGRIELVGSAAYHAILPLVPAEEAESQIREHEAIVKKTFGSDICLKGFFPPEMAYSPEIGKLIKACGYDWVILDEISAYGKLGKTDPKIGYTDKDTGLKLVFRDRNLSSSYVPETILKLGPKSAEKTIITATDAEIYGLRHIDFEGHLYRTLNSENAKTLTISEYLSTGFEENVEISPVSSSWESTESELRRGIPYALWNNKSNELHSSLWKLVGFIWECYKKYENDENHGWARWHLVRGLQSCTFWWSSRKDFSHIFGPIAWSPDEVEKGINELVRALRSLENSTTIDEKIKGERYAIKFKKKLWEKHWKQLHGKSRNQ